ncbi:hypothetical protein BT96DRAFT_987884 [Gymnopus androsaceus JB14]|uniref:Uncharacterized protein n=1 Tax=Gymnopus androsaceus JB14 TaxID=1447944 RepID=A0A6A4I2Z2_9AGAR|nr:hypothetical protein BT96DRAFT_987884 [Gymnopus androsaceus JB14]
MMKRRAFSVAALILLVKIGKIYAVCEQIHENPPGLNLPPEQLKCGFFRWRGASDSAASSRHSSQSRGYTLSPPPPHPPPPPPSWSRPPPSSQRATVRGNPCRKCCSNAGRCSVNDHHPTETTASSSLYNITFPDSTQHVSSSATTVTTFHAEVAERRTNFFESSSFPSAPASSLLPLSLAASSSLSPPVPLTQPLSLTTLPNQHQQCDHSPAFFTDVTKSSTKENTHAVWHVEYIDTIQRGQAAAKAASSYIIAYGWSDVESEEVVEHPGALLNGIVTVDETLATRLNLQYMQVECYIHKTHSWTGIEIPYYVRAVRLPFLDGVLVVFLRSKGVAEPPCVQHLLALGSDADPIDAPGPLNSQRELFKKDLTSLRAASSASRRPAALVSSLKIKVRPQPAALSSPLSSRSKKRIANSITPPSAAQKGKKRRAKSLVAISSPSSSSALKSRIVVSSPSSILSILSTSPSPMRSIAKVKVEPKSPSPIEPGAMVLLDSNDNEDDAREVVIPARCPDLWPGSYFAIDIVWVFELSKEKGYQGEWDAALEKLKQEALRVKRQASGSWKVVYRRIKGREPQVVTKKKRAQKKQELKLESSDEWEDDSNASASDD